MAVFASASAALRSVWGSPPDDAGALPLAEAEVEGCALADGACAPGDPVAVGSAEGAADG